MPEFLILFLLFCAGVFLHMSALHFLLFSETASHPMIRMWKYPKIASAVWGAIQLSAGMALLIALNYRPAFDGPTLAVVLGFSLWGISRAWLLEGKK